TQQSGLLNLKIADIVKDNDILKTARFYAIKILKEDPGLLSEKNRVILTTYRQLAKQKNIWTYIS
ncbi:MAG: ATP-dependent DNA helicase RecG, partial [Eudoraea sp.]|nr:ATP-dependent DNA helicase RecG [Eudoraea sp.]